MIIGITGSLGTGKTTVAKMFAAKGAGVLDADRLAHMALKRNTGTYRKIISCFGREILNKDRSINRVVLAKIAFNNRSKLKALTNIIHPFVIKKINHVVKKRKPKDITVIDAPLLIEANLTYMLDKLIVVKASRKKQLLRCMKNKKLKKKEVMARIRNQMPLGKKVKIADYLIDNNGTLKETEKQVDKIWRKIRWI